MTFHTDWIKSSENSGDILAVLKLWQGTNNGADWLQVGQPDHLNWLEKSAKGATLLIRKPQIKLKHVREKNLQICG